MLQPLEARVLEQKIQCQRNDSLDSPGSRLSRIHFAAQLARCLPMLAIVVTSIFFGLACRPSARPVRFIVPNGFHGAIRIVPNVDIGVTPPVLDGEETYSIPANGTLRVKGKGPFTYYQELRAQFEDGTPIVNEGSLIEPPPPPPGMQRIDEGPAVTENSMVIFGPTSTADGDLWFYVGFLRERNLLYAVHRPTLVPGEPIDSD